MVGLGVLVSETGHVPLLYRTYSGNGSDQSVLAACLGRLAQLHEATTVARVGSARRSAIWCETAGFGDRNSSWSSMPPATTA